MMEQEEVKKRFESLSELKKIRYSVGFNKKLIIVFPTLLLSMILDCFAFNYLTNFLATGYSIYIFGIIGYLCFSFLFAVMAIYCIIINGIKEEEFLLKYGKNSKA